MMGKNGVKRGLAFMAAASLAGAAGAARAEGTVFGGVIAGGDNTAYLGVSVPLPGARVGQGPAVRAIVGGVQYKYDAAVGRVRGEQVRADVSLLYQVSSARAYFDAGLGVRYVDTRLSPRDPGNTRRGGQWEAVVSASGEQNLGPWQLSQFGSYGFSDRDYFVRGDVTRAVAGPLRLGLEAQADGARDYSRQRYGVVVGFAPSPRWVVKVSGGASEQSSRSGGYGGVSFRAGF